MLCFSERVVCNRHWGIWPQLLPSLVYHRWYDPLVWYDLMLYRP